MKLNCTSLVQKETPVFSWQKHSLSSQLVKDPGMPLSESLKLQSMLQVSRSSLLETPN
jgi:hypothetical protein